MDLLPRQDNISINEIDEFAILLDGTGHILLSNEKWMAYCQEAGVSEAFWKNNMNYMESLQEAGKNVELRSVKEVLDGTVKNYRQMSQAGSPGELCWFLMEIKPCYMIDGTTGAVVLIQKVDNDSFKEESEKLY